MNAASEASSALSLTQLIFGASFVVQLVMLLLLGMACTSVAIILYKWRQLKSMAANNHKFLNFFWERQDLEAVAAAIGKFPAGNLTRIFQQGYNEYRNLGGSEARALMVDNLERTLGSAIQGEMVWLERRLPWLATTASSAPFIGLFGTVWGIMQAFLNIGAKGSTSLAVVAPGIAEALVATAIGLFAAIPAAIFYNLLTGKLRKVRRELESFAADLTNQAVRSTLKRA